MAQHSPNRIRRVIKGGWEDDAFTRWRRYLNWGRGVLKWVKRKANKRARREWKEKRWM